MIFPYIGKFIIPIDELISFLGGLTPPTSDEFWNLQQILREISPKLRSEVDFFFSVNPVPSVEAIGEAFDSLQDPSTFFCRRSAAGKASVSGFLAGS